MSAVIYPIVGWPFGVFLIKQFAESVPTEMIEAAMIYAIKPDINNKNTVTYNDEPIRIDIGGTDSAFAPYKKIQLTKDSEGEWKILKQK